MIICKLYRYCCWTSQVGYENPTGSAHR